jgi:hypothetical protein
MQTGTQQKDAFTLSASPCGAFSLGHDNRSVLLICADVTIAQAFIGCRMTLYRLNTAQTAMR